MFSSSQLNGKVKTICAHKPGDAILKVVEEEKGDLIVLGSRGSGTIRRHLIGSVSDYVMHHAHIPVLVCKHHGKHVQPEDLEKLNIHS